MPRGVERPSIALRSLAKALIACSALLLFQGKHNRIRDTKNLNENFVVLAASRKWKVLPCENQLPPQPHMTCVAMLERA